MFGFYSNILYKMVKFLAIKTLYLLNRSSLYSYPAFQGGFKATLQTRRTSLLAVGLKLKPCSVPWVHPLEYSREHNHQLHKATARLQLGWEIVGHGVLQPLAALMTHEALGRHSLHQDNTILKKKNKLLKSVAINIALLDQLDILSHSL